MPAFNLLVLRSRVNSIFKTCAAEDYLAKQKVFCESHGIPMDYEHMTYEHVVMLISHANLYLQQQAEDAKKVYVLVLFHGLNVQDVFTYTGRDGWKAAAEHFERYTGISYEDYTRRNEDNQYILGEDEEGTEIYVTDPIDGHGQSVSAFTNGGIALWKKNK
jgi:hypothetical protein